MQNITFRIFMKIIMPYFMESQMDISDIWYTKI